MIELYGTPIGLAGFAGMDHGGGGSARLYLLPRRDGLQQYTQCHILALLMLKRGFMNLTDTVCPSTPSGNREARQIFESMGFRGISGLTTTRNDAFKGRFSKPRVLF